MTKSTGIDGDCVGLPCENPFGRRRVSRLLLTATAVCVLSALGGCSEISTKTTFDDGSTTVETRTYVGPIEVSEQSKIYDANGKAITGPMDTYNGLPDTPPDTHEGGPGNNDKAGGQQSSGQQSSSDIRVKRDLVAVGHLANGIHLYHFRYNWADQEHVGVVAQEVVKFVPSAVSRGADGYLRVDYGKLGLRLETWDEWLREHPHQASRTN